MNTTSKGQRSRSQGHKVQKVIQWPAWLCTLSSAKPLAVDIDGVSHDSSCVTIYCFSRVFLPRDALHASGVDARGHFTSGVATPCSEISTDLYWLFCIPKALTLSIIISTLIAGNCEVGRCGKFCVALGWTTTTESALVQFDRTFSASIVKSSCCGGLKTVCLPKFPLCPVRPFRLKQ